MNEKVMIIKKTFVQVDSEKDFGFEYDRFSPVIFIVGVRESGQDFVRGFLNMQPEVSCDEENLIFPEDIVRRKRREKKSRKKSHKGVGIG